MRKEFKNSKGITIVALIITIIILLILTNVTISISENVLLKKTTEAKKASELEATKEQIQLKIVNKLDQDVLTDGDLEDVYKEYGEIEYDDNGRVKGVIMANGLKILTSDIWKGKIYPNLKENDILEYSLTVVATQNTVESDSFSASNNGTSSINSKVNLGSEYEIKNLALNSNSEYKIQKVWFTDTASVKFSVKYGEDTENESLSLNVRKVIQAGNLDVELLGDIKNGDQYQIMWKNRITKEIIINNAGNLALKYKINLSKAKESGNLGKYLKVYMEDENGNVIENMNSIEGTVRPGESNHYNLVFSLGEQ